MTKKQRPRAASPLDPEAFPVREHRLDNGLRVLLLPKKNVPTVSYFTFYEVGSRNERPGITGLAHFFEHMMFNETSTYPLGEFDRLIDAAGGESNAATWIDWTYYHEALPAEELPLAIRLESDRMTNLVVREPQVESEREVVMNERRMSVEDDVYGKTAEVLHALAFGPEHPHGWPTIGWMADIEGYRVQDCQDFYRTWYAPNNATIVVVGDFDRSEVLALIQEAYGSVPASKLPERPAPPAPDQREERRQRLTWPTPSEKLSIGWHSPPHAHYDSAVMEVIDELLTGGRSARLRQRLVEELELAAEIRGGVSGLRHGGLLELSISMREGVPAEKALAVVDEEIERLIREPVSDAELDKVKNRSELFFLSEIEGVNGKASQIGFADVVVDDPGHTFVRLAELRRVSAADVQRVAAERLRVERRSLVHVVPDGSP